jgi:predicted HicB family RNase H-like nuclease
MMKYKGYFGHVEYDDKAKIFHGEVVGLKDIITFQGENVQELEQAFKDSVDDYLAWCKKRKEKPEKTFSGTFNLRIPPDLHAKLALQAKTFGVSLNSFITQTLLQVSHPNI